MHFSENQSKDFVLSGTSALSDLLNLSIVRVFGGVSAILSHQIKKPRNVFFRLQQPITAKDCKIVVT